MVNFSTEQLEAAKTIKSGNILVGGVGSGKSRTSLLWWYHYIGGGTVPINESHRSVRMKTPKDLYIITTAHKRDTLDWEEELIPFVYDYTKVHVTVDSWNNIKKYENIKNSCFIFDEQRVVGYGVWSKAFIKIAREGNLWILLSATPGDTYSDYMPVMIANNLYKNKSDFEWHHIVYRRGIRYPVIERYIDTNILDFYIDHLVIKMKVPRHTNRIMQDISVGYDKATYDIIRKKRFDIWNNKPYKNVSGLTAGLRKVVDTDISRSKAVQDILQKHKKAIIFYNYTFELNALRDLMHRLHFPYSEWNGEKHEPILNGDSWVYLVQYTAGAEGWNCITTDTIIFYSLNYSYKIMEQACGRIDRMNTKFIDLYYFRLVSNAPIDKAIAKSISSKKKFNEKIWLEQQGITFKENECPTKTQK
jgi:glutaredoxin-related protein